MTKMTHLTKVVTTAVCFALCVVLPLALHAIPDAAKVLSPMHIPVLLCGLVCGWPYGLACGVFGPLLSSILTEMPAWGYLPTMMVELVFYGLISGLLIQFVHTGRLTADLYISLLAAMLALIFAPHAYSIKAWATGYFVTSFPAIIVQLILIPILYLALQRARLIPPRYQTADAA